MSRKQSYLTALDQFCGAGGSSLGAVAAGVEVVVALNHWKVAVETHQANFPATYHECTDISACDPRRYPATDILITSPECTAHSQARGKARDQQSQPGLWEPRPLDPSEERSRATMWDVPRFAEFHDHRLILVENVVEVRFWRCFDAWLKAMHDLDYCHETVYFNSMFAHPTPQSRDRMYIVFWKKGHPAPDLRICPPAWCARCACNIEAVQSWKNPLKRWGRYGKRGQYLYRCPTCLSEVTPYYYAAANAIDWTVPLTRIADRVTPLKPRTLARIRLGLERFAREPFTVDLSHPQHQGVLRPLSEAWPTQTTAQSVGVALPPFILGLHHLGGEDVPARPLSGAWPTQTARQDKALVVPPFLVDLHGTSTVHSLAEACATVTASGTHHGLLMPMLLDQLWEGRSRPVTDPVATVVAGGNHHGLLLAPALPFLVSYYGQDSLRPITAPMGAITTIDRHALVDPGDSMLPAVQDCAFRMLQPHEIGRAMAFPDDYVVLGDSRQKVRQYGNAVTPPVMQLLLKRCVATFQERRSA